MDEERVDDDARAELTLLDLPGQESDEAELTWQERALCAQTDPEAFFPEKGGSTREVKRGLAYPRRAGRTPLSMPSRTMSASGNSWAACPSASVASSSAGWSDILPW